MELAALFSIASEAFKSGAYEDHLERRAKLVRRERPRAKKKGHDTNASTATPMPLVIDIETGDPDDMLTLIAVACHPRVNLKAVTVSPGSQEQLEMVHWVLQHLGMKGVRLGGRSWPTNKDKRGCVTGNFYKCFGRAKLDSILVEDAGKLIADVCDMHTTLFTGGPVHNLGDALDLGAQIGRWVGQGGFCGVGVVPPEVPTLKKFAGLTHCATWNFGGAKAATLNALASKAIARIVLVGKNVCHRCEYTTQLHERMAVTFSSSSDGSTTTNPPAKQPANNGTTPAHKKALQLFHTAMLHYIKQHRQKKLHDPLAAMCALDESIVTLREVVMGISEKKWGAVLCKGTGIFAAVDYDHERFVRTLLNMDN